MDPTGDSEFTDELVDEPRLVLRQLTHDDYETVSDLHRRVYTTIEPWSRAQFDKQIELFPEGQLCIELDGKLVGTSNSLIVETDDLSPRHTLRDVTANGEFSTHDPEGDALYGVDIAVDPDMRGMRIASRLYDARKNLVLELGLRRFIIGGRMPGYYLHAADCTPEQYVRKVLAKELSDPVISAQVAQGFVVRSVIRGYLPNDQESKGNAVLMEWRNADWSPSENRLVGRGLVRVAAAQYRMRPVASFDDFAMQCEFFADTAGDYRVDFLLFPELLTTQLLGLVPAARPALAARRLHEFTEQYLELFAGLALSYNVNIIGGTHLVVEDGSLYNIAYLFHRDGRIDKQYKIHITPSESRWWGVCAGDEVRVFDTDRGKIAIFICYDSEFPEMGRIAAANGAKMIFVPYNTDLRQGHLRVRYCSHARAIENHVYMILAGAVGNLPKVEGADIHYAQAAILTPSDVAFARDAVAAEATPNSEALLVHDLDLDVLRRTRRSGTVRPWHDRRTDLYKVHYSEGDDGQAV